MRLIDKEKKFLIPQVKSASTSSAESRQTLSPLPELTEVDTPYDEDLSTKLNGSSINVYSRLQSQNKKCKKHL